MHENDKRDLQWLGAYLLVGLMWTAPAWLIVLGLA